MFIREKCDACGDCLVMCQYTDFGQEEARAQFESLLRGDAPDIVASCVTCVACNQYCPKGANPFDLILERQEQTGVLNIPEQNTELFRNMPNAPSTVIQGDPAMPSLSLCSVGDLVGGLFDGPIFEGMTVLKGGDYFCGVGWIHLGHEAPVRQNAPRVIANLAATGASEIVFYHDDCYALAASIAADYGIDVPFKPVHIIEYLFDHVRQHESDTTPLGLKVAYQQPCASRYTPWKDEQLDELFERLGVRRVSRRYDREMALCCGSPLMPRDRERAAEVKDRNVEDALASGAEAMAYLCPLCVLNLRKVAGARGLENLHLIELVNKALYE